MLHQNPWWLRWIIQLNGGDWFLGIGRMAAPWWWTASRALSSEHTRYLGDFDAAILFLVLVCGWVVVSGAVEIHQFPVPLSNTRLVSGTQRGLFISECLMAYHILLRVIHWSVQPQEVVSNYQHVIICFQSCAKWAQTYSTSPSRQYLFLFGDRPRVWREIPLCGLWVSLHAPRPTLHYSA